MKHFFAAQALLPTGMADNVRVTVNDDGVIVEVRPKVAPRNAEILAGPVLPGMPNLHCHAFQRAMAGLAERAGPQGDSFWSWRETMYGLASRISPDDLEAIAAQLYVEMLKSGFTTVGEFHYVHNDPSGKPFARRTEMSDRIAAAAATAGIGLTLLPVLYGYASFGGKPSTTGQRRFVLEPDAFLALVEALRAAHGGNPLVVIGAAPHSLRAVTPDSLREVLQGLNREMPVHIHIAEQIKEVEDCVAWCGQRPVEWLLANASVDSRWCLVHATHLTPAEVSALAGTAAVAGLCPTTEANLGDGVFPLAEYLSAGGALGVGSDSNVSVSPVEELRWLEYGQRLTRRRRNVADETPGASVGASLWTRAAVGGARALAQPVGAIAPGRRADLIVLDREAPTVVGRSGDFILDGFVFAGNRPVVRDVLVGGRFAVREGHHAEEERIAAAFGGVISRLADHR